MTTDQDEAREARVNAELASKSVIVRDGARGWRLGACFISDACDLLISRTEPELPEEDAEDYSEVVHDLCCELEDALYDVGYFVAWNDGYVIYQGLSEEARAALTEVPA
jgi:hypothetical protein